MTVNPKIVTVFGTSKAAPGDDVFELAFRTGKALAENGFTLANGGYGGTMLAAAKGARSLWPSHAGGKTIGVTCTAFGRSGPNEYITEEISTASLEERLSKLVELGDAYIVLPGGTGTLLELANVWEHKNKHLSSDDKPIIVMADFWATLLELMEKAAPHCTACLEPAQSPEHAVEIIKKYL